jgi:hypothetical protein
MSFPQLFQTQAWNGKNLSKSFNLYLALDLASKNYHDMDLGLHSKADIKIEGGRCGTVLPLLGGMFVFLLSAKEADEHTGGNG